MLSKLTAFLQQAAEITSQIVVSPNPLKYTDSYNAHIT